MLLTVKSDQKWPEKIISVRSKSLIHTVSSSFFSHESWDWWWACHRSIISHHLDHLQSRSNAFKWSRTRREKLSVRSIWTQLVIALSSHSQILAPSINKKEFIYLPKNIINFKLLFWRLFNHVCQGLWPS